MEAFATDSIKSQGTIGTKRKVCVCEHVCVL